MAPPVGRVRVDTRVSVLMATRVRVKVIMVNPGVKVTIRSRCCIVSFLKLTIRLKRSAVYR